MFFGGATFQASDELIFGVEEGVELGLEVRVGEGVVELSGGLVDGVEVGEDGLVLGGERGRKGGGGGGEQGSGEGGGERRGLEGWERHDESGGRRNEGEGRGGDLEDERSTSCDGHWI